VSIQKNYKRVGKFANFHSKPKIWGKIKNHPSLLPMEQVFYSIFCDVATLVIDPPQEELAKIWLQVREDSIVESF
jgi:hypothetical protein